VSRPQAFVTQAIPEAGISRLRAAFDVEANPGEEPLDRHELAARAAGADALVALLTDTIDAPLLDRLPRLRIVAVAAVGYDNVDVAAATERGVWVSNTPDVLTETTADLAWALMLGAARRLGEAERYLRAGRFTGWTMMTLLGADVHDKTLGIVGFGRIGRAVARRALGFGMRVLYNASRPASSEAEREANARHADLETLLRESDFVSLHVPLNARTRHLIGVAQLALMKRTAFLVNTARGPVVDEEALAAALRSGTIAGAGLDVFEREPSVHPDLLRCENALLVPHIGSATIETRERMATTAAENCLAVARGARPPNAVNEIRAR
jgi:glyoxylate reductase